ncbi:MAG TPA: glycosyltransferase family 2 protein [Actinomycetota bacterium]|nr:glycosyltransferase family 2 protein [Actinomycetota bacterium]
MPDVILPVLNEANAIPGVLARLPKGFDPLVVDNGSTDDSGRVAGRLGAHVVWQPEPGFGAACWAGLLAAESEIVAFMDCDGSLDAAQLPQVTDPITHGKADLVIGCRRAEAGAWPPHARLANLILARLIKRKTSLTLGDLGPMRSARREELLALDMRDRRFGWPLEMVLKAHAAGWRIASTDVTYTKRAGCSKVTGTVRGTLKAVADMTRVLRHS